MSVVLKDWHALPDLHMLLTPALSFLLFYKAEMTCCVRTQVWLHPKIRWLFIRGSLRRCGFQPVPTERLADLAICLSWPQGYQRETSQSVRGMQVHLCLPESPRQKSSVSGTVYMTCSQRECRFLPASLYFIHPMSLHSHQLALRLLTGFPPITGAG